MKKEETIQEQFIDELEYDIWSLSVCQEQLKGNNYGKSKKEN
jgi:hypothetical protein